MNANFIPASILTVLIAASASPASASILYEANFSIDTFTDLETESTYKMLVNGFTSARASNGKLLVVPVPGSNQSIDFGAFNGDIRITFDTSITGTPGAVKIGDNGAFRIDGPGGHFNYDMGFVPTLSALNHVVVDINASTGVSNITIIDGVDSLRVYHETFAIQHYVPSHTMIGLSSGGTGVGIFDNLVVSSVPEVSASYLLAIGLAALAFQFQTKRVRSPL